MIRCAECNEEQMDGLEYCDICGAKLEAGAIVLGKIQTTEEAPAEVEASTEAAAEEAAAETAEAEEKGSAEAAGDESAETPEAEAAPEAVALSDDQAAGDESAETPEAEAAPEVAVLSDDQAAVGSASLTITRGGTVGKVFELQAGDNLVGRWDPDSGSFPEVDMENDDPEARISRKHALIKFGSELTIEDIGSLNGTFVNRGQRLEPGSPVPLKDGDEIIVGKTFFKVSHAQ